MVFQKKLDDYIRLSNDIYLKSLFSYKYNGTMDEQFARELAKQGIGKIKDLDYEAANDFMYQKINYKKDSLNYSVVLDKKLKEVAQDVKLCVMRRVDGTMYLFNELSFSDFDSNNNVSVKYDANWVTMNDVPLYTTALNDTYEFTKYYAPLVVDDELRYYSFSYDGNILKDIGFDITYERSKVFGGVTKLLNNGDKVTIMYNVHDSNSSIALKKNATTFTYNDNYRIESGILPDGEYACYLIFEDMRGEKHLGDEIYFSVKDRRLTSVISRKDLFDENN